MEPLFHGNEIVWLVWINAGLFIIPTLIFLGEIEFEDWRLTHPRKLRTFRAFRFDRLG